MMQRIQHVRDYRCLVLIFVAVLALMPLRAKAQLEVSLKLEHPSYLQFEPINAFVTIYNDSYGALEIDEDAKGNNSSVEFRIERTRDEAVPRTDFSPVVSKLKVAPGEKMKFFKDVTRWYNVSGLGSYFVTAVVTWNNREFKSDTIAIDIVSGVEILSMTKNAPGYYDIMRKYSLRYWSRNRTEYLFLSVSDPRTGNNYGVFQLGRVVRVNKPKMEIDKSGDIIVFHQSGVKHFSRSHLRATKDQVVFVDQTYHLPTGDPYPSVE